MKREDSTLSGNNNVFYALAESLPLTAGPRFPTILLLVIVCACTPVSRNALPAADHLDAVALGSPDIRYWGDEMQTRWLDALKPGHEDYRYAGISHREHNYLILSGGGANGAYGAGILVGWSELGTRPEFTLVTGVSTGALTAPFAFLGERYDYLLRQLYTETDTEGIYQERNLLAFLYSDAVVDPSPLIKLIETEVDDEFVQALAVEASRGRVLMIGTTNLDAGRSVVWEITKIAASGHPGSAKLIRQVMLASASVPGIFPPVYIQVQTPDGRSYDEMHVDGGTSSQFFFYPSEFDWNEVITRLEVKGRPKIYVIRNGKDRAKYEAVSPSSIKILSRTASTLIRHQGVGDFFKIWSLAERDGLDTKAAFIRRDLDLGVKPVEAFDPVYMRALFNLGFEQALANEAFRDFTDLIEGR